MANLSDFNPATDQVDVSKLLALDAWVLEQARLLQEQVIAAYDDFAFHLVCKKIQQFCSVTLGGFYLDIIKDRQYTTQTNSIIRRSAQTAMYHIVQALVRWLAPILSFTAEEIWQYLPGKHEETVFFSTWYEQFPQTLNSVTVLDWDRALYNSKVLLIKY